MRIVEMCRREGVDFVTGLFRRMLDEAEAGARKRLLGWPDGTYRCVTFSDAAGNIQGLMRNCCMKLSKRDDTMVIDFTGTSPENLSSYNAHPQAVVGHLANYIYEYVFHDLPISSATFAPIDFVFPEASCLSPTPRAATSNAVMICTGAMSAVANCISRARYPTYEWKQATASMGNGGNATVIAGVSQWNQPFADMIAYPINTEGQGARSCCDGMDAYGFPWCAFGRAPDVESIENEFPMVIPFSQHWPDSGGAGRYRGGCGTAQFWAAHHVPALYFMAIADNSVIQTPQRSSVATRRRPCRASPSRERGSRSCSPSLEDHTLDFHGLVNGEFGELVAEPFGRATRAINGDETVTIGLSTGGAGFGDPLERDLGAIEQDLVRGLCSAWSAREVYCAVWDAERQRVDREASEALRHETRKARIARGQTLRGVRGRVADAQTTGRDPRPVWFMARRTPAGGRRSGHEGGAQNGPQAIAKGRGRDARVIVPLAFEVAARISARPLDAFRNDPTQLTNALTELHGAIRADGIVVALAAGMERGRRRGRRRGGNGCPRTGCGEPRSLPAPAPDAG